MGRFSTSGKDHQGDPARPHGRRSTRAHRTFTNDPNQTQAVDITEEDEDFASQKKRRFPRRIGPYDIIEEISRGGMGIVYKALDVKLQRQVAIKVLLAGDGASDEDIKRFQREGRASARLQHPNIVQIHAVGEYEGKPYFVMDFVEGYTVKQLLEAGPISPRLAMGISEGAAEALDHAARQGVIHRDVKPANIIVTKHGVARLMDFGLARRLDEDLDITQSGTTMGTPSYMSPEQAEGKLAEVDAQSDVYSVGAVLYEMLTGQPPFDGATTLAVLQKVLDDEPIPPRRLNPRIHIDIQTICLKCLEKEKRRRYRSGHALAEDIRRFNAGEPIAATPIGFVGGWIRHAKRHLNVTLSVLAGLALGLTALGYNIVRSSQERQDELMKARDEAKALHGKGKLILDKAADEYVNLLTTTDSERFEKKMETIREKLKAAEEFFREAQLKYPGLKEPQDELIVLKRYMEKLEIEHFVFMAANFLSPKSKDHASRPPPPNYPAALAFAEEALSRDPKHERADLIRKSAIGIRAVTIITTGANAEVFAKLINDDPDDSGIDMPRMDGSKGVGLGWTPISKHEMSPGLYKLTFYAKSLAPQEATLRVSRDSDPTLTIEIGARESNMVFIPKGEVTRLVHGRRAVPAFYIDRFEYPNQAGQPPITDVTSLVEARDICQGAGKVLCTADQWIRACVGEQENKFPYGPTYKSGLCATGLDPGARDRPFPSGWFSSCRTEHGIFDMSGNVSEWTDETDSEETIYGGDWADSVRTPDLLVSCRAAQIPGVKDKARVGVRCCKPVK